MHFLKSIPVLFSLAALTLAASKPPTPLPCEHKYFTQQIDHQGQHNGTFQQQYSIFEQFYKPGGPIMFFQSEQITYMTCANDTILYEWAQELNGLVVSLEHRYFGNSKPFGSASNTTENLKYLTLDNVMDDAVEFLDQVKKNCTKDDNTKVIMASGSYGGFLSGAFRLNRPEAIYGSLASAGPVKGMGNSSDPEMWDWWLWTSRLYQDKSHKASMNIKKAFDQLTEVIASGNYSSLQSQFGLCTPATPENVAYLPIVTATVFTLAAEFNYPIAQPILPLTFAMEKMINISETETDPLMLLNRTTWLYLDAMDFDCINLSPKFAEDVVPYIEWPYFNKITCTYMPMNAQAYMPNGTIFPAMNGGDLSAAACEAKYGAPPLTQQQLNERYGFSKANLENSTRIIWSVGEYDPTGSVEPEMLPLTDNSQQSRVLYAQDVAHIEDLFRSNAEDGDGVKILRQRELEIIKGWLDPVDGDGVKTVSERKLETIDGGLDAEMDAEYSLPHGIL